MKVYELYTYGPNSTITNLTKNYKSGMWIVKVKAKSIKQAYYLLGNEVYKEKNTEVGIISIDNSCGPSKGWPWSSRICYPSWWK